jgi:hypothetical protein
VLGATFLFFEEALDEADLFVVLCLCVCVFIWLYRRGGRRGREREYECE